MTGDSRAALVTGASSGIGLAVATALAELGYDLTLVARDPDRIAVARDTLGTHRTHAAPADLAEDGAAHAVLEAHLERHGRLDVLVHSAGVGLFGAVGEQTGRQLDLQIDLNVRALTRLVSPAVPHLEKAGREHGKALVAVISSLVGVEPQPGVVPYGMTKAAQRAFCAGAHRECAQHGVQFTAICPALVDTPGASWAESDGKLPAEDVAETVRFLLRTSAACFVPEIQLHGAGPLRLE
ncbi:SDR family oxidoreductase [Prauserella flavalba]|uniref:Short-chain dehydrogenase n=1 Tax=Prauserella flavalba TaxID=1477506 RepID=A0A318LI93_9PSEU|nr:SDR family oxidoreductase [Prauserella flavalba]PXY17652.1 hypothetical protein BA062_37240 [Prauserella flavalba]PXY21610.1 hypothetical protein BA062_32410 [Prauserella flavalba]